MHGRTDQNLATTNFKHSHSYRKCVILCPSPQNLIIWKVYSILQRYILRKVKIFYVKLECYS